MQETLLFSVNSCNYLAATVVEIDNLNIFKAGLRDTLGHKLYYYYEEH